MFDTPANEDNVYSQHMIGRINDIYYKDYANAKYWYEKARANDCIDSIYNLGQLCIKLNEYSEADKYFKEGTELFSKKCEYMLASLYYKKSLDIYQKLADEKYENCTEILANMPKLDIDVDDVLTPDISLQTEIVSEEEYVPIYILDIKESLDFMLDGIQTDMIIEEDISE